MSSEREEISAGSVARSTVFPRYWATVTLLPRVEETRSDSSNMIFNRLFI